MACKENHEDVEMEGVFFSKDGEKQEIVVEKRGRIVTQISGGVKRRAKSTVIMRLIGLNRTFLV